jgi:hypothetical protein
MTEDRIKELFYQAIAERGVYKKLGWTMSKVSNYKTRLEPELGIMLEVLYKLNKISINEHS